MKNSPATRVRNEILRNIATGILREGEPLESIRDLCRTYCTSKDTVCKALSALRQMGMIELASRKVARISARPENEKRIALIYASKTEIFHDSFWCEYANGILGFFEKHPEYRIEICNIGISGSSALAQLIERQRCCGIISLGYRRFDRDNFRHLNELGLPTVLVGPDSVRDAVCVGSDFSMALDEIADSLSFRTAPIPLYCLHAGDAHEALEESGKLAQVQAMLRERFGVALAGDDIVASEGGDALAFMGRIAARLRRRRHPNLCILDSDSIGPLFFRALHDARLRCPEDVVVISFDNLAESQFTIPALTTIELNRAEAGAVAAQKLLDILAGRSGESMTPCPARAVMRDSICRRPKQI